LALGKPHHLLEALDDRDNKEDILEDHPSHVFDPAPGLDYIDSIDVHRRQHPEQAVMNRGHRGGGDQHAPIAVKGQQGEPAKDVKMSLDPAAGHVD